MAKKLYMVADYKIHIPGQNVVELEKNEILTFISTGGFSFTVDGKNIDFDFDAAGTSINLDDGVITFVSGRGPFFNEFDISEDYKEAIENAGVKFEDVTAEFLSKASSIDEFFVDFELDNKEMGRGSDDDPYADDFRIEILSISFFDENETEYSVADDVIKKFNNSTY